jgi:hypothetical protein
LPLVMLIVMMIYCPVLFSRTIQVLDIKVWSQPLLAIRKSWFNSATKELPGF